MPLLRRFARDHFADEYEEYHVRLLRKASVRLVSMTQDLGDDPPSLLVRQVFALFAEYQSSMFCAGCRKNARQGFWSGSAASLGYQVVAAAQAADSSGL
ncbi:hypothetical protein AFEL58S_03012 [Afipia felis]